ncbi:hypothetical protein BC830DRAFT_1086986, partial [Chytriomyces sp. MP71]
QRQPLETVDGSMVTADIREDDALSNQTLPYVADTSHLQKGSRSASRKALVDANASQSNLQASTHFPAMPASSLSRATAGSRNASRTFLPAHTEPLPNLTSSASPLTARSRVASETTIKSLPPVSDGNIIVSDNTPPAPEKIRRPKTASGRFSGSGDAGSSLKRSGSKAVSKSSLRYTRDLPAHLESSADETANTDHALFGVVGTSKSGSLKKNASRILPKIHASQQLVQGSMAETLPQQQSSKENILQKLDWDLPMEVGFPDIRKHEMNTETVNFQRSSSKTASKTSLSKMTKLQMNSSKPNLTQAKSSTFKSSKTSLSDLQKNDVASMGVTGSCVTLASKRVSNSNSSLSDKTSLSKSKTRIAGSKPYSSGSKTNVASKSTASDPAANLDTEPQTSALAPRALQEGTIENPIESHDIAWQCSKKVQYHDFFISYRVATDQNVSDALENSLGAAGMHPYLDHLCLVAAEKWEDGFLNGLRSSKIVLLVVSEACLTGLRPSNDNVVLEWELAFERQDHGEAIVVPLFMNENGRPFLFPDLLQFPDVLHDHAKSPRQRTIRKLASEISELSGVHVYVSRPNNGMAILDSGSVARLLQIHWLVKLHENELNVHHIFLSAKEEMELRHLVSSNSNSHLKRNLQMNTGDEKEVQKRQVSRLGLLLETDCSDWMSDINTNALIITMAESEHS